MRIVTWNCSRGKYATKVPLLNALAPDIAVIQECARPGPEVDNCVWFGDNPDIGVAVKAAAPYRVEASPIIDGVPKYVVPVAITGPSNFTLFAVWSTSGQQYPYVQGIAQAVDMYRDRIAAAPTVI